VGKSDKGSKAAELAVNSPVLVYPDTQQEQGGVIVEDFGPSAGQVVEVGSNRIADAARRWAVRLNSGDLVFANSDELRAL
jgi:co-chaperonin GroES (HSP10)